MGDPKNPVGFVVMLDGSNPACVTETWHEKLEADDGSTTHARFGPVASMLPGSVGNVKGSNGVPLCETSDVSLSRVKR